MAQGWIMIHRKIKESSIWTDSQAVHLWLTLLINANHAENEFLQNGSLVRVKRGQVLTGRKALSAETGINESKIQRLLKTFEKCHMIEQLTNNRSRLISILNYDQYQASEQPVNNQRTTNEQQMNTNNNVNNKKNEKKEEIDQVLAYLNEKLGKKYRTAKGLLKRFSEGYSVEDAIKVIDNKITEWGEDEKMKKYLTPDTLFSEKFDKYLNQEPTDQPQQPEQTIYLS